MFCETNRSGRIICNLDYTVNLAFYAAGNHYHDVNGVPVDKPLAAFSSDGLHRLLFALSLIYCSLNSKLSVACVLPLCCWASFRQQWNRIYSVRRLFCRSSVDAVKIVEHVKTFKLIISTAPSRFVFMTKKTRCFLHARIAWRYCFASQQFYDEAHSGYTKSVSDLFCYSSIIFKRAGWLEAESTTV